MKAKAQARFVHVTPQKARRVMNVTCDKHALNVVGVLRFVPRGAAEPVRKLVELAIVDAQYLADQTGERFDTENLYTQVIYADEGPTMKHIQPRA